jgi:NAD(P)-dependent dehydrogenase (short-subunit alcohol dehydrogenase family)
VNAVCPGVVETNMVVRDFEGSDFTSREEYDKFYLAHYPQGENARYTNPEEVASCILFLANTEKVEPVTGACLSIDFGITAGY